MKVTEQNQMGWAYGMGWLENGPPIAIQQTQHFDWLLHKLMLLIG
jgi:hypothetical protein